MCKVRNKRLDKHSFEVQTEPRKRQSNIRYFKMERRQREEGEKTVQTFQYNNFGKPIKCSSTLD